MQLFSDFISSCSKTKDTSTPESLDMIVAYRLCRICMCFKLAGSGTNFGVLRNSMYQIVKKIFLMFFLNSLSRLFAFIFHIIHLFLGFLNINAKKRLYTYCSGLGKLVFQTWAGGILTGFNHHLRCTVLLKLDPGHTFLEELGGIMKEINTLILQ